MTVPLAAEYLLDAIVAHCYPTLNETHALEDRVGHGIILFSLLPTSHIPLWILGSVNFCLLKDCLIGLSHAMVVCGVLGKLQNFANDIWTFHECVLVMSLFAGAQLCFICGNMQHSTTEYHELALIIACGLKTCSLVAFISSTRNISKLWHDTTDVAHSLFATRKYFCSILCFGLIVFMAIGTLFCNYVLYKHQINTDISGDRILMLICAVLLLTVLPARIIRRGITAVENSSAIEREMTLKKTFIRYVSHEVRSPLSTTSLGIDCLINILKGLPNSKVHQEIMDLAQDCRITCTSAINTLNDLLLIDKIESNMLHIDKERVYCKTFLQDSVRPFIRQLELSGISFEVNFDPLIQKTYVLADPNKLEQVVRNFIGNAVKFTPAKGKISVSVTITMNGRKESCVSSDMNPASVVGTLRFSVVDTGAGISFEDQKQLFQQYVQFNPGKLQGGKGSGLGLWISKTIIDMHDGKVGAYSGGEGKGSTFYFELPCQVVSASTMIDSFSTCNELFTKTTQSIDIIEEKNKLPPITIPVEQATDITSNAINPDLSRTVSTVVVGYEEGGEDEKKVIAVDEDNAKSIPETTTTRGSPPTIPYPMISSVLSSPRSFLILSRKFSSSKDAITRSSSTSDGRSPFLENTSKRLKILLADDSALTRKMVERLLAPLNPIIHHASNGAEAVNMVLKSMQPEERIFDVVIIDYLMPEMDGGEAIHRMREKQFDGLICAVTGSTTLCDQERLLSNGASMIMGKPFNYKIFYNCLREFYHNVDWDPSVIIPYED